MRAKLWLNFLDHSVNGRPHAAMRLHAAATVHVKAHMRVRACVPVSTEITRRPGLITLIRWFNQVHQVLNHSINSHINIAPIVASRLSGADDAAPDRERINPEV
jgi:hypothetical protein